MTDVTLWTQADLDSLRASLRSGQQSWRYGDRGVTYFGLADLLKLEERMLKDINAVNGVRRPRLTRIIQKGKGY